MPNIELHPAVLRLSGGEKRAEPPWGLGRSHVSLGRQLTPFPSAQSPPVQVNPSVTEGKCFRIRAFRNIAFLSSQLWCLSKLQVMCPRKGFTASWRHGLITATVSESLPSQVFILFEQTPRRTGIRSNRPKPVIPPSSMCSGGGTHQCIIRVRNQRHPATALVWGSLAALVTLRALSAATSESMRYSC